MLLVVFGHAFSPCQISRVLDVSELGRIQDPNWTAAHALPTGPPLKDERRAGASQRVTRALAQKPDGRRRCFQKLAFAIRVVLGKPGRGQIA